MPARGTEEQKNMGTLTETVPAAAPSVADVLLRLAERCEAAEPSTILDLAIDHAITGVLRVGVFESYEPPPYTASLDAAVPLVPPNYPWVLEVMSVVNLAATVYSDPDMIQKWSVFAKSPALALCAAALRARAALTNGAAPDSERSGTP